MLITVKFTVQNSVFIFKSVKLLQKVSAGDLVYLKC